MNLREIAVMAQNRSSSNKSSATLLGHAPVQPPSAVDDSEQLKSEILPETSDAYPVFGSQVIHDEKIVGTDDPIMPLGGEDRTVNYDPENDPRMQEPLITD